MLALATALTLAPSAVSAQAADEVRLTDAAGRVLVRVAAARPTFRLSDGAGTALGEVRAEQDRVKLRDPGGTERWKIKRKDWGAEIAGTADVRAGAWLALAQFSPAERAALWAYFSTVGR